MRQCLFCSFYKQVYVQHLLYSISYFCLACVLHQVSEHCWIYINNVSVRDSEVIALLSLSALLRTYWDYRALICACITVQCSVICINVCFSLVSNVAASSRGNHFNYMRYKFERNMEKHVLADLKLPVIESQLGFLIAPSFSPSKSLILLTLLKCYVM